jgi:hypothetical protein
MGLPAQVLFAYKNRETLAPALLDVAGAKLYEAEKS